MPARKDFALFPAFIDLRDKRVVVIGGGEVAARKVQSLVRCGARVSVVTPEAHPRIAALAREKVVACHAKRFEADDLAGAFMAFAATDDEAVNGSVAQCARELGIAVNVADDPRASTFLTASVVDRGPVQVAISTSGASPALARRLRARIEGAVPEGFGRLAALAGRYRAQAIRRLPDPHARRRFWERVMEGPVAALVLEGREAQACAEIERALALAAHDSTESAS